MKKLLSFCLLFLTLYGHSQTVQSSCSAPDSIKAKYKEDADRLALQKILLQNLSDTNSVFIPQAHSDSVMNALMAVYNATMLPARDSVITMFQIHTLVRPGLNDIYIAADSNLFWMQQLRAGMVPTGNFFLDSLITQYSLHFSQYYDFSSVFPFHSASFLSDSNLNIRALAKLFETMPGVYFSANDILALDGNNITDSIYSDHIQLVYSFGWGDCMSGCMCRRFWEFNVYFDCSVQYAGSYGCLLHFIGVDEIDEQRIKIFPNPAHDILQVKGNGINKLHFTFFDLPGKIVFSGMLFSDKTNIDISTLARGIYFLKFENSNDTFRIVKQ